MHCFNFIFLKMKTKCIILEFEERQLYESW